MNVPRNRKANMLRLLCLISIVAEVIGMLIERGADVSAQNQNGETPLHLASREGHAEVVGMLIECGADLSAQGEYEDTPLHRSMPAGPWVLIDMSGAGAI